MPNYAIYFCAIYQPVEGYTLAKVTVLYRFVQECQGLHLTWLNGES